LSLSRIINKTPLANEKCNVYEIDTVNSHLINQIVQSRFVGEGIYCLEQFSMPDYKEQYLITPSFDKQSIKITDKDWNFRGEDIKELTMFELVLNKSIFMPLDTKQFSDLFNINLPSTVFMQTLLCKRMDNWRDNAIEQYSSFLKGNETPLESKFTIRMQERVLNVLTKIGNYTVKRDPIEEMENKILQNNYRFECRFVTFEKENVDHFVSEIQKNLKKLQLFNEITLKMVKNKQNLLKLIENREFQPESVNQLLSEQELYSLLCSDKPSTLQKVELEKPIKQQGIIKHLEESMLLQKAIQLMPFSEKKDIEIDQSKIQQLNQAFKRVGIVDKPLKTEEVYQGSSLLKVQLKVPPEITYTKISKKVEDIQGALGNKNISIEIGDKPDTINVFLPLENRDVLYFRNVLESAEFQDYCKNNHLPIIIGENVNGGFIFADLTKLRHMLVAGATGGGKSIFVNLIILSLLLNVPSDELVLYLIDPKMVEFTQFNGFPQVKKVITDMRKANALLESLTVEMDNRYEIFSKVGVRDIQGYNELDEGKMKYIVCAIDEFADLMMVNKAVEEYVVRLGQKARGAGIHLIIATQRPSVDVITGLIKANMPCRIAFSTTSAVDSKTILDKGGAEKLLGRGDGLAKIEGNKNEFERFQSPVLTLNSKQETKIYEELKGLFSGIEIEDTELPEANIETEIDKLKRIISNTGETRVSELQSQMNIGQNKVHALLKELVDEEWLTQLPNKRYQINVDETELSKWREKE
jgi:S-DNA-T family DNA segregation ATPase FtsK/SpoIIIE